MEKRSKRALKAIKWKGQAVGTRRKRLKFAWLPKRIDCGLVIWLEKYWSYEELCRDFDRFSWKTWKTELYYPPM